MLTRSILWLFAFFSICLVAHAQSTLYSTGNGQWNTADFWTDGNGNFYTTPDDPNVNIVIRPGHTVTVTVGNKACHNLTVQPGGALLAASATNRYINIYGPFLDLAGTVGGPGNGLSFNVEGPMCTLSATGNVQLSRLRKSASGGTSHLTIEGAVTLHYAGTALTNQTPLATFNIVINGSVAIPNGSVSLDGVDGTNSVTLLGSLTVNGVLTIGQHLYLVSDNPTGQDISYTIGAGATVQVGGRVYGNAGVAGGATVQLTQQGQLLLTQGGTVFTDIDWVRNTFSLTNDALIQYAGSEAVIESFLPYGQLSITGGTAFLNGNTNVSHLLDLQGTVLSLSDFDLVLSDGALINAHPTTVAYVQTNGFGGLRQMVNATPTLFPVGNSTPNPARLTNIGTPDRFRVRVTDQVLGEGLTGAPLLSQVVNRTWHLTEQTAGGSHLAVEPYWSSANELADFDRQYSYVSAYHTDSWQSELPAPATVAAAHPGYFVQQRTDLTEPLLVSVASNGALPAEWGAFRVSVIDEGIRLQWSTQQERHTDHFRVQWSQDGYTFSALTAVPAAGSASAERHYEYLHTQPVVGTNYYRLRLIDSDGSSSYSVIEKMVWETSTALSIYPNPSLDYVRIAGIELESALSYRVLDGSGNLWSTGWITDTLSPIDITDWPAGRYVLLLGTGDQRTFIKP